MKDPNTHSNIDAARATAGRFLRYAARSSAEIERRLDRAGFDKAIIERVVAELSSAGSVNDEQFAAAWIADRADRKRYGKRRLADELTRKGVCRENVTSVIAAISDEDEVRRAAELAERKSPSDLLASCSQSERMDANNRLSQMLQRRGFAWDVVKQVLALREKNRNELS